MSDQGYDEELRADRSYVAGLYVQLDAERARVQGEYDAALCGHDGTPVERDVQVRWSAKEVKRLGVADNGLCFGRLDALSGERSYIGRIGLFDADNDYKPVLLDWRAPASRAFYLATAASPENMRRRRRLHTRGRRVVDFSDEVFGGPEGGGDAALLAAVNPPRGAGMRDIVATIQAEQDESVSSRRVLRVVRPLRKHHERLPGVRLGGLAQLRPTLRGRGVGVSRLPPARAARCSPHGCGRIPQ